jgi:hypothetical protein
MNWHVLFPKEGDQNQRRNQLLWGFLAGNVRAGKSLRAILMLSMTGCATKSQLLEDSQRNQAGFLSVIMINLELEEP